MMKKLLFTALAALTAAGLSAAERLEIPPRFQAQPATSANQPPRRMRGAQTASRRSGMPSRPPEPAGSARMRKKSTTNT